MSKLNYRTALRLIDDLCVQFHDTDESLETANKYLDHIYRIAHPASACLNPHKDWVEETVKEYAQMPTIKKEKSILRSMPSIRIK